jgi:cation:H+ antiporter
VVGGASGSWPAGTDWAVGLTLLALTTSAELFALARVAVRRDVAKIAMPGVVGSVACNATAWLGTVRLVRPLAVRRIPPAIAAGVLPLALLVATPRGRMGRAAGAALVVAYAVWVTVLRR